uniref:SAM domain-containing protein n=1 Tax=Spongospora subterranea TaxID=70186 RepID=A0A0H5QJB2_9EUKA|eukprot:CRZ02200.1 hypothetical protein [Spongospora subterranea]
MSTHEQLSKNRSQQMSTLANSAAKKTTHAENDISADNNVRYSIERAAPDEVFKKDISMGLADTSWEREEVGGWISDDDDHVLLESTIRRARLAATAVKSRASDDSVPMASRSIASLPVTPASASGSTTVIQAQDSTERPRKLGDFLAEAGMQDWVDKFVAEEIDLDCIADLTDEDLIELGMEKLGVRRRFQRAVRDFLDQHSP